MNVVYISYNVDNKTVSEKNSKTVQENGEITFYIGGNYFECNNISDAKEILPTDIKEFNLKTTSEIINYRNKLLKEEVKKSEKSGTLRFLMNYEIFEQIYILEKKNNSILKYPVTWLEVIECQ
jgi:hypothetical protein